MVSVTVSWGGSSTVNGYYVSKNGSQIADTSDTSYTDSNVSIGDSPTYTVEAYNDSGTASDSESIDVTVAAPSGTSTDTSIENEITVSWTDNSSQESGYRIYRDQSGGSLSQIADISSNSTSYRDTGLVDGEKYFYQVEAYGSGTTARGSEVSGITVLPAPSGTSATTVSDSQIDLAWTDNSDNESGFEIFRGTTSGSLTSLTTVTSNSTSYSNTGLNGSTTYYYRVESYTGHTSASGSEVSATTESSLSAPTNVHFNDTGTEDELTLDWDEGSNATGYYVYRSQSSGSSKGDYTQVADVTNPPYTDTGLEDGEQYYYRVSSHD